MESIHLYNTRCPACAKIGRDKSGDNLGVFNDGHTWCWACGYRTLPTGVVKFHKKEEAIQVFLPDDVSTYIPAVALEWLRKYDITTLEIINNKLLWSEYWQQLIFPYFSFGSNLVGWQGRSFRASGPKWFSRGNLKTHFHILPVSEKYDTIVLVEDVVSAIKVSRQFPAMPLFGNTCLGRLKTLYRCSKHFILWLDPNMHKKSLLEASKAREIGLEMYSVLSEKDPKEHTDEEIHMYLDKLQKV